MVCATDGEVYNAFTAVEVEGSFVGHETIAGCDCPCDDLVDVERPKMSIMALSYIAQVIVVTIIGFNMGFRFVRS